MGPSGLVEPKEQSRVGSIKSLRRVFDRQATEAQNPEEHRLTALLGDKVQFLLP